MYEGIIFIPASEVQADEKVREQNEKSRFNRHGVESCWLCCKGMSEKAFENAWHIHMTIDHSLAPVAMGDTLREADDQGWFPVGSECAKKIPLTHRKKFGA